MESNWTSLEWIKRHLKVYNNICVLWYLLLYHIKISVSIYSIYQVGRLKLILLQDVSKFTIYCNISFETHACKNEGVGKIYIWLVEMNMLPSTNHITLSNRQRVRLVPNKWKVEWISPFSLCNSIIVFACRTTFIWLLFPIIKIKSKAYPGILGIPGCNRKL